MADKRKKQSRRRARFQRARLRQFFFTHGPDRLSGGRIVRRHHRCEVVIRRIEICNPNWPRAFDGLRIGHVSDFHLGHLLPLSKALAVVEMLGDEQPDLVACTGDVVDLHHEGSEPLFRALADVGAALGTVLVLGNHDELDDRSAVERIAIDSGLLLLQNEAIEITRNGEHFVVAGIDWGRTLAQNRRHVDATCDRSVHLLLAHNPKAFRRAAEIGIPLTLAGHTHGGQIARRKKPNQNLALTHRHSAGLFERRSSNLFVTTGVGAWFPLRINCPPEIVILTVRSGPANATAAA